MVSVEERPYQFGCEAGDPLIIKSADDDKRRVVMQIAIHFVHNVFEMTGLDAFRRVVKCK